MNNQYYKLFFNIKHVLCNIVFEWKLNNLKLKYKKAKEQINMVVINCTIVIPSPISQPYLRPQLICNPTSPFTEIGREGTCLVPLYTKFNTHRVCQDKNTKPHSLSITPYMLLKDFHYKLFVLFSGNILRKHH